LGRRRVLPAALLSLALAACGDGPDGEDPIFERAETYAVSHILVDRRPGRTRTEAMEKIRTARGRVASGESFAAVARAMSEDEATAADGGFLGFVDVSKESRFAGAVQAILPGETRGPVESGAGYHLIHRHGYEEARRRERESRLVVRGFIVSSRDAPREGADRSPEEARKIAEEALERVRSGEMTLGQASQKYADRPGRPDALLEVMTRREQNRWIYDEVAKVPEGALVPHVVQGPGLYAVLARGTLLRSVVRFVLVAHHLSRPPELAMKAKRTRDEAKALAEKALKEVRPDGSNWADIVTRYSDDVASAPAQGAMGLIATGMLPPELEAVLLETPPGRVASRLAESEAGFHVLWRVD
jgi:hypothetical protein